MDVDGEIMKKSLFLLDGYSIIYRSYFAFIRNPLFNPEGKNSSAVFGFFRILLSILNQYNPGYFAVVLDSPVPTFRHEAYAEYKANREKAPDDLHAQVPVIKNILKTLRIPILREDRYEADDIMAAISQKCNEVKQPCYLITGDKDLLQLVKDSTKVLKPDKSSYIEMGEKEVTDSWGITPDQILDYLSLIGDQSDNVPGVKGIGPKTAVTLLGKYQTLDNIYNNLQELSKGQREKLTNDKDSAYLSKKLITLCYDVPNLPELSTLELKNLNINNTLPLFIKEGAKSLVDQLKKIGPFYNADGNNNFLSEVSSDDNDKNLELFTEQIRGKYECVTSIKQLNKWVNFVKEKKVFAFDVETDGIDPVSCNPVGFSISVKSGEACYIPLKSPEVSSISPEELKSALKEILEEPSYLFIGQNLKFDYKVLKRWGIEIKSESIFDTMIAAWLLDSIANTYNMDVLAEKHLNYETIHFKDIVPKGSTFDEVPLDKASDYAAEDSDITFRLYELFAPKLKERKLDKLFYETEMPLVRILGDMELEGIKLNSKDLEEYSVELKEDLFNIEKEIYSLCGHEFNINSTKQLQVVLFEERKLKPIKKTKTGFSTDIKVLQELSSEDPVPALVLKHRSLAKLKSTYVDTLPVLVNETTNRLHTQFIQTGTATGRMSSRDPNLQNIPIKDEAGRRIRSAFVAKEGTKFLSADYSQVELVVFAHLSGDPGLQKAFNNKQDIHAQTASFIFNIPEDQISSEQRRIAKTINFGVIYGMSAFRLSNELKISRKKAVEFIDAYFNTYSKVKIFMGERIADTETNLYATTILGRQRFIPGINSRNKTEKSGAERIAVNTPIQGSAADIVKLAMVRLSSEIKEMNLSSKMILQVHDELIFEVPDNEIDKMKELVKNTMESVVKLDVPLRASVEVGDKWGELH